MIALSLLTPLLLLSLQADPAAAALKDMRSKDADLRLGAIPGLMESGTQKAGKALVKALKDDDWGVQAEAALALAGWETLDPDKSLVELALRTPVEQVRLAAAESLELRDRAAVIELLAAKMGKGKTAFAACRTLSFLSPGEHDEELAKGLDKLLRTGKEIELRAAAASALHLLAPETRVKMLETALADVDVRVASAACASFAKAPVAEAYPLLRQRLLASSSGDVLARRLAAALAATLWDVAGRDAGAAIRLCGDSFSDGSLRDSATWRLAPGVGGPVPPGAGVHLGCNPPGIPARGHAPASGIHRCQ